MADNRIVVNNMNYLRHGFYCNFKIMDRKLELKVVRAPLDVTPRLRQCYAPSRLNDWHADASEQ